MITQTNVQGPESNSSDVIKDMSPQTNIQTPSFEDDEFDIPQVALAQEAAEKIGGNQQPSQHPYHPQQHHYHEGYYQQQPQQQQWMGDYSQMNYHHYQQPQYQAQHQYPAQPHYYAGAGYEDPSYLHMGHTGPLVTPGPGRSPSGSHSTPSPHSQTDSGIGTDLGASDLHFSDLKRPHPGPESIPHQQCVAKKPKPSRRKKKRDPHEPQKPVSAYALFFRDRQASIKGRNPNLSFGEVSKLVAGFWDGLDAESKTHYKKRQELAKKEYLRQLAAYRASSLSKGHGEDMYGGYMPGYPNGGYHMEAGGHPGIGQNIPPHPHPGHHLPHQHPHQPQHPHLGPGAATFVTNSQDYLNQQTTAHHGTDPISAGPTGNSIPSLPAVTVCTPVSSHPHFHPRPGSEYPEDSGASLAPHDRNHNTMSGMSGAGECQRPGCGNSVTKAADGTMSTYCSSECVVGQCRDAYQGWEQQQHHTIIRTSPQQQTTAPHPSTVK